MRVHHRQCLNQRPRHARVQDVADDRDVQPVDRSELLAHRVEIEERLRRMLVLAVAGVHDSCVGEPRHVPGGADLRVPEDDHVGVVGRERERGVLERLALVDGRPGGLERHRVRREALRRELEAGRRACRRLVEHVQDQPAAERGQFLVVALL